MENKEVSPFLHFKFRKKKKYNILVFRKIFSTSRCKVVTYAQKSEKQFWYKNLWEIFESTKVTKKMLKIINLIV